jgi:50S ribosomal protein L16 3-hydroxylase
MPQYILNNFDPKTFIDQYWQKKPAVFKNAIRNFNDPIDENDLAALAQEDVMDSRIISCHDDKWTMTQGPFSEFEPYCKNQWTLLVQGVEHLVQETQPLLDLFNFIPNWRIDDLMVSYSVANAGVGPHLDQYDVFIIQGKGKRRWQVGDKGNYRTVYPHPKLTQIEGFVPIIDEVLESGDIIYIPPGYPHNGTAINECLNYSVGFRAPDQRQLFENIADFMLDSGFVGERYQDSDIGMRENAAQINQSEIAATRHLLKKWIDSDAYEELFARIASYNQVDPEPYAPEENYSLEEISDHLSHGGKIIRLGGVKPIYLEQSTERVNTEFFTFYIEKNTFNVPIDILSDAKQLLVAPYYEVTAGKESILNDTDFLQLLTTLINLGYWYTE